MERPSQRQVSELLTLVSHEFDYLLKENQILRRRLEALRPGQTDDWDSLEKEQVGPLQKEIAALQNKVSRHSRRKTVSRRSAVDSTSDHIVVKVADENAGVDSVGQEPVLQAPKNSSPSAIGECRTWPGESPGERKSETNVTSWVRNTLVSELSEDDAAPPELQRKTTRQTLTIAEDNNAYFDPSNLDPSLHSYGGEMRQAGSSESSVSTVSKRSAGRVSINSLSSKAARGRVALVSEGSGLDPLTLKWRDLVVDMLALASKELFFMKPAWVQSEMFLRKASRGAQHLIDLCASNQMHTTSSKGSIHSQISQNLLMMISISDVLRKGVIVLDPQSPKRLLWALFGMLLMLYDLVVLPMQAFELPDNWFLTGMSWVSQIFWTFDIGVSAITSYYVNGELEKRLTKIVRAYVVSWFPLDAVLTLPMWVVIIMGWDAARTGNSVRSARYMRMLRFLRLMRLVKFESLWGEALGFVNSASAILIIGMAKLMFCMVLLNHLVACLWFAVGKSGSGDNVGWALKENIESAEISYQYLSSMHWTLTQFQGTSDVVPGSTLAERIYAVLFLLCALFILTVFISSLTNRMMQFQALHSQRTYEERVVRGYLSNHDISHQLSVRIKKYLEWKQRLKRSQEYDDEVHNILPLELITDLLDEVRGPSVAEEHPFFTPFRETYPRMMRRLCFDALIQKTPMPGEHVFSLGDVPIGMYFIFNGSLNYSTPTNKKRLKQQREQENQKKFTQSSTQDWAMENTSNSNPGANPGATVGPARNITQPNIQSQADSGLLNVTCLEKGECLTEAILWTSWHHVGSLHVVSDSLLYVLLPGRFEEVLAIYHQAKASAVLYARRFVAGLNEYGKHYTDHIERARLSAMIHHYTEDADDSDDDNVSIYSEGSI